MNPFDILTRRRLLQLSAGSAGLSLGGLWQALALAAPVEPHVSACILIFYYGGPSQLDTYDMKPVCLIRYAASFNLSRLRLPGFTSASICRRCRE